MKEPPFQEIIRSYAFLPPAPKEPRRGFSIRPWLLLTVVIVGGWLLGLWLLPASSYREPLSHQPPYSTDSPGSDVTRLWPLTRSTPTMQVEAQATPQPSAAVLAGLGGSSRALAAVQVGVPVLNRQPGSIAPQSVAAQEVMPDAVESAGSTEPDSSPGLHMTSGPADDPGSTPQPRPSWSPTPAPSPTATGGGGNLGDEGSAEGDRPPSAVPPPAPTPHPTPTPTPPPVVLPPTPNPSPGKESDQDRDGEGSEMPCKAPGLQHSAGKALGRPAALQGLRAVCKP